MRPEATAFYVALTVGAACHTLGLALDFSLMWAGLAGVIQSIGHGVIEIRDAKIQAKQFAARPTDHR